MLVAPPSPRLVDRMPTGHYRLAAEPLRRARSLTYADLATALLDSLDRREAPRNRRLRCQLAHCRTFETQTEPPGGMNMHVRSASVGFALAIGAQAAFPRLLKHKFGRDLEQ